MTDGSTTGRRGTDVTYKEGKAMDETKLISLREASRMTGLADYTIRRLCRNGSIPCQVIDGTYWVPKAVSRRLRDRITPPEGYIRTSEAIDIARISKAYMYQLIRDGRVKGIRRAWFGVTRYWVEKASFTEWMEGRHNAKK